MAEYTNLNPYKYTAPLDPVKDRLVCITRDEKVVEVVEGLKKGDFWVVIGPVQVGKTTFLKQVENRNSEAYNLYLNMVNTPGDLNQCFQWLTYHIIHKIPHTSGHGEKSEQPLQFDKEYNVTKDFPKFVQDFQPLDNKKVVLLLEEVENLACFKEFIDFSRLLITGGDNRYSIILTGSNKLAAMHDFSKPLEDADIIELTDFSEEESRQLIEEPLKQSGITIEKKAEEMLIESVGGHPQLLQHFCYHLVEKSVKRDHVITEGDIADVSSIIMESNHVLQLLGEEITTDRRLFDLLKRLLKSEQVDYEPYEHYSNTGSGPVIKGPDSSCAFRNRLFQEYAGKVIERLERKEHIAFSDKVLINQPSSNEFLDPQKRMPMACALKQIQVQDYHSFKATLILLPVDAKWIFLTGENTFGKTELLRALTIGFFGTIEHDTLLLKTTYDREFEPEMLDESGSKIAVEIYHNGRNLINNVRSEGFKPFRYFAAYGPSRLMIQSDRSTGEIIGRSAKTYSIFKVDGVSLNIEREMVIWALQNDARYQIVKDILEKLLPHCSSIEVDKKKAEVLYNESEDENDAFFGPITHEELAAGNQSIVAMVGDILVRFYEEYEKDGITDIHPADFEGIVLIDELDLHLHPKWLREFPGMLSGIFPKIQFIAAVHSEIPILGAPKETVILKVTRTIREGIQVERLNVDFKNLLPHQILSSPIFGLEKIIPNANEKIDDLRTEQDYQRIIKSDKIKEVLRRFKEGERDFSEDLLDTDVT